ncbi:hypothetical protein GCK32_000340 [Trichostrongylus colubriformis]|uniref:Uncharacterized protein n=1 Tax=Trichostrongylus colubriformis TaxID=6319 RepID=A0AAN8FUJ6_TRICO
MYYVVFLIPILQALELPLAPYNVRVFCRQGRRYSRRVQTTLQCSSSTTACGYLEFNAPDVTKGVNKIGIYECVDNGILQDSGDDLEEDNQKLFSQICGPVPQCSHLNLDTLNADFVKYLTVQHGIQLEALTSHTIRFCCSLFHHTLQRLVTSEKDKLPSTSALPVHCQSEICGPEAVGCLLHSTGISESSEDYSEYYERRRKAHIHRISKRQAEEYDEGIDAVQLFFDFEESTENDPSLKIVTGVSSGVNPSAKVSPSTPEVKKPLARVHVTSSWNQSTTTRLAPLKNEEYDLAESEETHCVYRHLNDELYRYCLLVHQKKGGDRCYYHEGHTICCCFVHPDKETCDPTDLDLIRPPPPSKLPPIRVTPRPNLGATHIRTGPQSSTSASTTTSTSTTTTITTPTITTPTTTTTIRTVFKPRRIHTVKPKSNDKRCRFTYPRKKVKGSNARPVRVSMKLNEFNPRCTRLNWPHSRKITDGCTILS